MHLWDGFVVVRCISFCVLLHNNRSSCHRRWQLHFPSASLSLPTSPTSPTSCSPVANIWSIQMAGYSGVWIYQSLWSLLNIFLLQFWAKIRRCISSWRLGYCCPVHLHGLCPHFRSQVFYNYLLNSTAIDWSYLAYPHCGHLNLRLVLNNFLQPVAAWGAASRWFNVRREDILWASPSGMGFRLGRHDWTSCNISVD